MNTHDEKDLTFAEFHYGIMSLCTQNKVKEAYQKYLTEKPLGFPWKFAKQLLGDIRIYAQELYHDAAIADENSHEAIELHHLLNLVKEELETSEFYLDLEASKELDKVYILTYESVLKDPILLILKRDYARAYFAILSAEASNEEKIGLLEKLKGHITSSIQIIDGSKYNIPRLHRLWAQVAFDCQEHIAELS